MKQSSLFYLVLLLAGVLFVQDSRAENHLNLPEDAIARLNHMSSVFSVAFSPDGRTLASGSGDTVWLWDVESGQQTAVLQGHTEEVWSVAFSPDGRTLASGGWDYEVWLWDVESGQQTAVLQGHTERVFSVAFSPDGRTLASGSRDYEVWLWDVESGQQTAVLRDHRGWVNSVAFSPDGRTLASGDGVSTVWLWDVESGQQIAVLQGYTSGVFSVAFSPDGRTLASGGWDSTVRLWDVESGQQIAVLQGHTSGVFSVAFSPDGRTLASGGWDSTVRLWDVESGQQIAVLQGHTRSGVFSVAFSPDGRTLASGGKDSTVRLWDVAPYTDALPEPPEVRVSFGAAAYEVVEGASVAVVVRLDRAPERTLSISLTRTPESGGYSGVPAQVTFSDEQTEQTITLTATDDTDDEADETVRLGFGSLPEGVSAGSPASAVVTIIDDARPSHRTEVEATLLGDEVAGLIVEFSRSIAGHELHYAWGDTTNTDGRVTLTIVTENQASGYYQVRARRPGGEIVGQWNSIPLNENYRQVLELTLGGGVREVDVQLLAAAKIAAGAPGSGLQPNVPNPFNSSTQIAYRLAAPGLVRLEIYNTLGQRVRMLVGDFQAAGVYQVAWDARDGQGTVVAAGVYIARLRHAHGVQTRRLLYLK